MLTIPNYLAIIERGDYMSSLLTNFFVDEHPIKTREAEHMVKTHSRYYNYDTDIARQEKHKQKITYLKTLLDKKRNGIPLTEAEISYAMSPLQRAGIVDKNGNLTEHYRGGK